MKKLISVLAALFTVAVLLPCCANAAELASGNGWTLTDDGVLTITTGSSTNYDSSSNPQPWADYRDSIVEANITVSNGLGGGLLEDCTKLEKVTFVGTLGKVRHNVFKNCTSLQSIDLTGATEVRYSAFENCTSLTSVVLPDTVTTLGVNAFYGCKSLESVTLSKNITVIDNYTFQGTALKSIVLPEGITTIGGSAFRECPYLESITIPDTVTTIKSEAFRACVRLKSISLPKNLTTIGDSVFYMLAPASPISFPKEGDTYTVDCFESIEFPDTVTSMGTAVFRGCSSLKSANFPKGLTAIPENTFKGCDLETLIIPEGVTTIGNAALRDSTYERIAIPTTLTSIGTEVFKHCGSVDVYYYGGNAEDLKTILAMDTVTNDFYPNIITDRELVANDFTAQTTKTATDETENLAGVGVTLTNVDDATSSFSQLTWTLTSGGTSKEYVHDFGKATIDVATGATVKAAVVVKGVTELTHSIALQ